MFKFISQRKLSDLVIKVIRIYGSDFQDDVSDNTFFFLHFPGSPVKMKGVTRTCVSLTCDNTS